MSSLIIYTDEDQALVATDTLGVNNEGQPFLFTSKSNYLPHLQTIISGTGCGGFSEETGKMVSFAYRRTNDFVSEQLQYGTAVKPECSVIDGNLFETIPAMMQEQRKIHQTAYGGC